MQNNYLRLATEIRSLVSQDEILTALNQLQVALADLPDIDEVIIQSSRYQSINKQVRKGTIDPEVAGAEQNRIRLSLLELVRELEREGKADTQIFISHSHQGPGVELVDTLYNTLKEQEFTPFLDQKDILPGENWPTAILSAIHSSDYFVLMLSEHSNLSEMVLKEVEEARKMQQNTGRPIIIPIRIQWPENKPLNFKLRGWLDLIQQLSWSGPADSQAIVKKVTDVIGQRETMRTTKKVSAEAVEAFIEDVNTEIAPSPVANLKSPTGAVRLDSKYYITRHGEEHFITRVSDPGALLRIRGPRQFGKTSLLARVMQHAKEKDHSVIYIDFQDISDPTLRNLDALLWEFCYYFAEEFDCEDELENIWEKPRDAKQKARSFIRKYVLKGLDQPVLLAMDEADRVFSYPNISSDFFTMLRAWHEGSKTKPEWEKLKICISYSTEAKLAITDINSSPFNVGEEAAIPPFNLEQVAQLADLHQQNLSNEQLQTLIDTLGGQPYLIRRAMYLLAMREYDYEELMEKSIEDAGPFGDHLRHHLVNIRQFPELTTAMKTIISDQKCKDPILAGRLSAAGLIKGTPPNVEATCSLYHSYLKNKL